MKILSPLFLLLVFSLNSYSQVTGKVSDPTGEPLPYVNIYIEGSFSGTTSNENGDYELEVSEDGSYTVVFQSLGYKTQKKEIAPSSYPFRLDVELHEETTTLDEVVINSEGNPANEIMRQAIEKREFHRNKIKSYTADFYSRGIWKIENAPEKILGQEVGDLGGGLDSTRSGIIYLSETVSKITFRAPDDFKERIIASKVSGQDNGFSLNSARDATLNFYDNSISLNSELISPLADYAFNYYDYKLVGTFFNDRGQLINKIEVTPKRPKDRVFSGHVYIVEDSWQLFGVELRTTGEAMQVPPIEELVFKQDFNYSEEEELWVTISQTVDFRFGMFGISGSGRFTAVYTDYNFDPDFEKGTFGNEILSFEPEANKKDSLFWRNERPIPLTLEEKNDYRSKDSIQEKRESKPYLDSLDRVRNKFGLGDLLTGYTYSNSYEKWYLNFNSPLFNMNVNTVQGYNTHFETSFHKNTSESYGSYWRLFAKADYGFSEERLRVAGGFQQKFNNISRPIFTISGGMAIDQINSTEPISELMNGITTNFFERNYLKLYELLYFRTSYREEFFNGFEGLASFSFENRSPLFNHWNSPWVDREKLEFTSNNPLEPFNYNSAPFQEHHMFKFSLSANINFGQKYMSYPDGKYNLNENKYPELSIDYDKGISTNAAAYDYDHLELGLTQVLSLGNKGEFGYNLVGGSFFNDREVSFLDYRHFKGNQTRVGTSSKYLDRFNLLPYYALSTSNNYLEAHVEHNFQGWVLGKLPLINYLNFELVLGAHRLMIDETAPYSEFSVGLDNLGFGKFRFLRLDYVVSEFEGNRDGAFIFGLKFLNILQ